ncbi:hypothetical protein HSR122_1389 [Halapricum desulfuricans]|uniref:Uncharacterized protein n=1 Tax=Halapricum desulfuricans TaxID=2841257 RepID=A0A897NBJ9_9EURY|nr:hypothetical protein HSR122_1389 [Halapricum desulfuricans]
MPDRAVRGRPGESETVSRPAHDSTVTSIVSASTPPSPSLTRSVTS